MRHWLSSLRGKILLPPAVVVLGTIVATAIMAGLLRDASTRLKRVQREEFSAFRVSRDLQASLQRLELLVRQAEVTRSPAVLATLDSLAGEIRDRLTSEGDLAFGHEARTTIEARFQEYYSNARSWAYRERSGADEGKAALIQTQCAQLEDELADHASQAEARISEAFLETTEKQRIAAVTGPGLLLAIAIAALVFSWFFSGWLSRPLRELSRVATLIAGGNLREDVAIRSRDEVGLLAESFQTMVNGLRQVVGALKATAQELSGAADRLSDHTRAQGSMIEQQAVSLDETGSTTRELEQAYAVASSRASSVIEVARRAAEQSQAGREAAERSAAELHSIQSSVKGIVAQSTQLLQEARQVEVVVETVRDLAAQSHILSVNAAIEAHRAGEAGRAFGVVAREVRSLAEQSNQSTVRIGKMIASILAAVAATRETTERGTRALSESVEQVRAAGQRLSEIGGTVHDTSDAALQIAAAVQQQSTGISRIAAAMRDLQDGMEDTRERIRVLDLLARQIAETALRLNELGERFQM
jgi:methyl-accepting chemotaxis protein